jgi:hypothetical protein
MNRATVLCAVLLFGCFSPSSDGDEDLLSSTMEEELGTNPEVADSDGDGLMDGYEVHFHLTDPTKPDSDEDGDDDGWELLVGLDPLDPASRRYPNNWPHLERSRKEELERRAPTSVVKVGSPVRNLRLPDVDGVTVELYDFARDGRPVVLLEGSSVQMDYVFGWLEGAETSMVVGSPGALIREAIVDGSLRLIVSWTEATNGQPVDQEVVDGFLTGYQPPPQVPLLIDQGFQVWGHLGRRDLGVADWSDRSENGSFVVLDEDMIVRGINDWSVAEAMLTP